MFDYATYSGTSKWRFKALKGKEPVKAIDSVLEEKQLSKTIRAISRNTEIVTLTNNLKNNF
jgi:hypothetical protein